MQCRTPEKSELRRMLSNISCCVNSTLQHSKSLNWHNSHPRSFTEEEQIWSLLRKFSKIEDWRNILTAALSDLVDDGRGAVLLVLPGCLNHGLFLAHLAGVNLGNRMLWWIWFLLARWIQMLAQEDFCSTSWYLRVPQSTILSPGFLHEATGGKGSHLEFWNNADNIKFYLSFPPTDRYLEVVLG